MAQGDGFAIAPTAADHSASSNQSGVTFGLVIGSVGFVVYVDKEWAGGLAKSP